MRERASHLNYQGDTPIVGCSAKVSYKTRKQSRTKASKMYQQLRWMWMQECICKKVKKEYGDG